MCDDDRMASLESRVSKAEKHIQTINKSILRLAKLAAMISGVPEEDINQAIAEEEAKARASHRGT